MDADTALGLTQQMLWTVLLVAAPILLTTLVLGLAISIFQVVTQIQEMTLTFVPKLAAVFFIMLVLGPWMLAALVKFGELLIGGIPTFTG